MSFWQSLILVLAGAIIASCSYISKSFVFEPLRDFRETSGKSRNRLKYYSHIFANPGTAKKEFADQASIMARELSCEVEEKYYGIGIRVILSRIHLIPGEADIDIVAHSLIFLSNSAHSGDGGKNYDEMQKIAKHLWNGKMT